MNSPLNAYSVVPTVAGVKRVRPSSPGCARGGDDRVDRYARGSPAVGGPLRSATKHPRARRRGHRRAIGWSWRPPSTDPAPAPSRAISNSRIHGSTVARFRAEVLPTLLGPSWGSAPAPSPMSRVTIGSRPIQPSPPAPARPGPVVLPRRSRAPAALPADGADKEGPCPSGSTTSTATKDSTKSRNRVAFDAQVLCWLAEAYVTKLPRGRRVLGHSGRPGGDTCRSTAPHPAAGLRR